MPLKTELMAGGLPAALANRFGFDTPATGLSGAGTSSQANAAVMASNFSIFGTVAANSGAIISAKFGVVCNGGASPLLLYPPVGGNINGGTTNASFSVTNGKSAIYFDAGTTYVVILSA